MVKAEIQDQVKTRENAIKETLANKEDSWTETASKIKDDLTVPKDDIKNQQAEAGKFGSNDPHYQTDMQGGEKSVGRAKEEKSELYNPESYNKEQSKESSGNAKLGDWMQDKEEHVIIL